MKEVYLVKWSSGQYDEYTVDNLKTVFLTLFSAEKDKEEIENYNKTVEPFPFDFCDEETFVELLYADKLTTEDINKYDEWRAEKHRKSNFNCAWIEILTVTE
jgi:squalene cyclase